MPANPNHDALRHATATTLREDAKLMRRMAGSHRLRQYFGTSQPPQELMRLASLAEAVAKLDDHTLACLVSRMGREVYVASDSDKVIRADSLPAALAAMLDAEGT